MSRHASALTRRQTLIGIGAVGIAVHAGASVAQTKPELVTKPIPSTGERLPVIGIGTARRFDVGTSEQERAPIREVLQNLPKLGGRLVDTAPSYGSAETVIGELLAELGNRDEIFLATKVGAGRSGAAAGIREMEGSLQRLKTNRLDLLMVHNLAGINEMLPVLRDWKEKGLTRYIGMSTSFDRQYEDFAAIMQREKLDFIQIDYAIDNRDAEKRIIPLAADRGMAVLTNLPFGRGRVFQAFGKKPIPDWAKELGIETWAQFALKFIVSHPAVTVAIPGTARPDYLVDNLGAARAPMPDEPTRQRMADLIAAG
jgi:aryl-alcohol dehydrogenase-like predicted oxidoreductase